MLNYLSKFVLQMLPTISATVIGAYIVATWINPKTPPEPPKVAASSQEQQPTKPTAAHEAVPAAVQPAQEEAAEPTSEAAKAAGETDKVRIIPISKQPVQTTEAPAPASTAAADANTAAEERKNVNELARAAIQRLRGNPETARTDEAAKPVAAAIRAPQGRVVSEPAQPAATIAPPLPPAVSIASPRFAPEQGTDQDPAVYPERMSPPGEIPTARDPLSLQASHRVAENPSFADDFVSATKSFFRAITPQ